MDGPRRATLAANMPHTSENPLMTQADPLATERRPFRVAAKPVRAPRIVKVDREQLSPVDAAFGLLVVASFAAHLRMSKGFWYSYDDWPHALPGATLGDFLEPYNGHLSLSIIAVYRVSYTVFGFDNYLPWRIAGIAASSPLRSRCTSCCDDASIHSWRPSSWATCCGFPRRVSSHRC